jgi:hypothetical protein
MSAGADVRFDWEGSLALARRLWAFADQLDELRTSRRAAAESALAAWHGEFADTFAAAVGQEVADLALGAARLRDGAHDWAAAWTAAIDQQNRVVFARACDRVRSGRSWLDTIGGWLRGHDDLPAEPAPRRVPQPPNFVPERGFAVYEVLR